MTARSRQRGGPVHDPRIAPSDSAVGLRVSAEDHSNGLGANSDHDRVWRGFALPGEQSRPTSFTPDRLNPAEILARLGHGHQPSQAPRNRLPSPIQLSSAGTGTRRLTQPRGPTGGHPFRAGAACPTRAPPALDTVRLAGFQAARAESPRPNSITRDNRAYRGQSATVTDVKGCYIEATSILRDT
jgi:hypothetical protein